MDIPYGEETIINLEIDNQCVELDEVIPNSEIEDQLYIIGVDGLRLL